MIQLTRQGVVNTETPASLRVLREQYERDHYVILPQLYEPALLEEIMRRVEAAPFVPKHHVDVGLELCMDDGVTESMLGFFPNNPAFLRLVEQITGQPRVGRFIGRVYRLNSSDGHYDSWHGDCCEQRVVTMSLNLSRKAYAGGALQMKLRDSNEIIQEVHNTGLGDALLFRISDQLLHRVQEVIGDTPKTAFAGWFLDEEDFLSNLPKRLNRFAQASRMSSPDP